MPTGQSSRPSDVRSITILGATGSIGASTVDLIKREPEPLSRRSRSARAAMPRRWRKIAREVGARAAVVADTAAYRELKRCAVRQRIEAAAGEEALIEAAERPADWVMAAISRCGRTEADDGGDRTRRDRRARQQGMPGLCRRLFMRRAASAGATVLPVDSEHNAVFQALGLRTRADVRRVILTASGGPFRTWSQEAIKAATPEQALRHPNWSMGPKVTIDSASLMNKGLEMIEAHHLFALTPDEIDVLVHPQSVVHGMVEFRDGSVVAQLGSPDMRIPIAHCLAWPRRIDGPAPRLDLAKVRELTFEAPDLARFPALALARRAMETGGAAPTVLNAADEVAVAEFIAGRIGFTAIAALVEATLDAAGRRNMLAEPTSIDAAMAVDHIARSLAKDLLPEIAVKAS